MKENPISVECSPPVHNHINVAKHNEEVAEAHKNLVDVNNQLMLFQLKPAGLKGEDLFKYIIKFRSADPKLSCYSKTLAISEHLNIEISNDNKEILKL